MAQFLRPDSNITQTNFVGGFAAIDEITANDADFAYSADRLASVLEVGLSDPAATPGSGTCTVRYRIAKVDGGVFPGTGGSNPTATMGVYEGATQISAGPAAIVPPNEWTAQSFTFNASLVTDWTNVRLRFSVSSTGGSATNARGGAVSWAEIEAPDAAPNAFTLTANLGSFTLTGNAAQLTRGYAIAGDAGAFALTGNDATLVVASPKFIDVELGIFTLTGNVVNFAQQYKITIDAGDFALTGNAATIEHNVVIIAEAGAFSLTGNAATLVKAAAPKIIAADTGTFALTGGAPSLSIGRNLDAATASFSLVGNAATFASNAVITANTGTFVLSGQQATLRQDYRLTADTGNFALSGNNAAFAASRNIEAGPSSFVFTGNSVNLSKVRNVVINADNGTFALSGNDAAFARSRNIDALSAQFVVSGNNINLARALLLGAGTGSIVLNGLDVALEQNAELILSAGAATFSLVGSNATLVKSGSRRRIVFIF